VTFYKGLLHSLDDYYQLSSEMVMLQTTNVVHNHTLYRHVTPQSLLAWHRVRVANMMAQSGREWYQQVRRYNSGRFKFTVNFAFSDFSVLCSHSVSRHVYDLSH